MLGTSDLDSRDAAILAARQALFDSISGPRVGDFVVSPEGTQRIAYIWNMPNEVRVQTSAGGSYHLNESGHVSMSGALNDSFPASELSFTEKVRDGAVWFFHHGVWRVDNGVDTTAKFRVYHRLPFTPELDPQGLLTDEPDFENIEYPFQIRASLHYEVEAKTREEAMEKVADLIGRDFSANSVHQIELHVEE